MPEALLRIGEVARRTGVRADLVRAWERRYGLLEPRRTEGGFRLYTRADLARLRLMQHYLAAGMPAAQAADLVHQAHSAAFDANPGVPAADVRKALRVLRESLEEFDDAPAERILERLLGLFAPGAVLRDVVLPYLRDVGERWACGQATVAQEHFASSFLEGRMLAMAQGWSREGTHRAVLACVPGERHVLGLITFGLAMRDLGWRITYLGADAPVAAVEHAANAVQADVIVFSAALAAPLAAATPEIRELARRRVVAIGGAGVAGNAAEWRAPRSLPADPLVAALALTGRSARAAANAEEQSQPHGFRARDGAKAAARRRAPAQRP